jgi:hypothetical protein
VRCQASEDPLRDRSYFENFTVDASIFVVTTSY